MCIIAIKEAGVKMPDDATITTMWMNNPDGAGFMYAKGGKVYIEKGFMKLERLLNRLHRLESAIDVKGTPFVLHFRITTHGGTTPENCHPFPISNNVAVLQKPSMPTDIGVAHNGIIPITPRPKISDTMEYIVTQLAYLKRANKKFYENKNFLQMIENAINSKMVFLSGDGKITTIGRFEDHDGMVYSNGSYMPRVSYSMYDTSLSGDWSFRGGRKNRRSIASIKPLMSVAEGAPSAVAVDGRTGEPAELDSLMIDKRGKVYEMDWEAGCAFQTTDYNISGKLVYNADIVGYYECYGSMQELMDNVYGLPW